ncbi:MAG: nicotinate-nucleotide adenylyltransferase [Pseudomonadales bacterium]|nr:nicotinate-nucleotide adenylyltransferase [Pseudomonadales bacterium]MDP6472641.1 nicotinate-nucleotide adenylyltransferase [Pseudomonadales bacterium]
MKLICLFGGTFDPVHEGHLAAARTAGRWLGARAVRMLLAARPGHRSQPAVSIEHRWQMLRIACEDDPVLVPDDFEVHGVRPSYTVETLERLRHDHPGEAFFWIMGGDAFADLGSWHRCDEVLDFCHLVLLQRPGRRSSSDEALRALLAERATGEVPDSPAGRILTIDASMPDISATAVRRKLAHGDEVAHLLPAGVLTYIRQHGLYA